MGLLNDMYDAADQAMSVRERKKRKESMSKSLAKQKAKQAAQKQSGSDSLF